MIKAGLLLNEAIAEIEQLRQVVADDTTEKRRLRQWRDIYHVSSQELDEAHETLDRAGIKRQGSGGRIMGSCERIELLESERNQLRQEKAELEKGSVKLKSAVLRQGVLMGEQREKIEQLEKKKAELVASCKEALDALTILHPMNPAEPCCIYESWERGMTVIAKVEGGEPSETALLEDIQALQARLKEETGLECFVRIDASDVFTPITAEDALKIGELLAEAIGVPAEVQERGRFAWVAVGDQKSRISATIFCKELLRTKEGEPIE